MAQSDETSGRVSTPDPAAGQGLERARATLRAGSTFQPRALAGSELGMSRLADRWAPEGIGALRQPSLRALSFVDHLLAPQRTFADAAPSGSAWWMFPVPWYGEESQTAAPAGQTR